MDQELGTRIYVLFIAVLVVTVASGCAADGWDCVCKGGALAATHPINGQLIAEMARDQP